MFHDEIGDRPSCGLGDPEIRQVHDIGMAKASCRVGLALEALQVVPLGHEIWCDHLHSHCAARSQMHRPEDSAHAPFPNQGLQLVLAVQRMAFKTGEFHGIHRDQGDG